MPGIAVMGGTIRTQEPHPRWAAKNRGPHFVENSPIRSTPIVTGRQGRKVSWSGKDEK
jgi:hypothetical protein